ncbi:hypothetical protein A1O1_05541 [Capronia coronata CBS 617.96]|uniref:Uncharacterized protein n=1 Tax=Capronia coronata CBS 617.96 TaxID=1182541 RepID=W9YH67_9EURO|nr:uncharacterized protein A1O1_05541 [Capronia coronata CBS 617.96]EXJ88611.1 hypothetical protein A1O1_05541 [Capronia coronata CBS 617.96]
MGCKHSSDGKELDRSVDPEAPPKIGCVEGAAAECLAGRLLQDEATSGVQADSPADFPLGHEQATTKQECCVLSSPNPAYVEAEIGIGPSVQTDPNQGNAGDSSTKRSDSQDPSEKECHGTSQTETRNIIGEDLESGKYDILEVEDQQHTQDATTTGLYGSPPTSPSYCHGRQQARSDATCLPDRNMPFNIQILEHVKDWAELGSRIEDGQRRKEVLDRAFETLTNVWYEALRLGYDPGHCEPSSRGTASTQRSRALATTKRERGPGRPPGPSGKARQKSPSKIPVFVSRSHKDSHYWAVTAGELQEAGVSEERICQRAASGDLEKGDALLEAVRQHLGTDISRNDWWKVTEVTHFNPWGRNLLLYALYEVQMSRQSIEQLERLYRGFSHARQKENTQKRIDDEKERLDLFMALALEVKDSQSSSQSPTVPTMEIEPEQRAHCSEAPSVTDEDLATGVGSPDSVIKSSEVNLNEADPAEEVTFVQTGESTENSFITDGLPDGPMDDLVECKEMLDPLMVQAKGFQPCPPSENDDQEAGPEFMIEGCGSSQVIDDDNLQTKRTLELLLPLLNDEHEVTTKEIDADITRGEDHLAGKDYSSSELQECTNLDITTHETGTGSIEINALKHPLLSDDDKVAEDGKSPTKKQKTDQHEHKETLASTTLNDQRDKEDGSNDTTLDHDMREAHTAENRKSVDRPDSKKGRYISIYILPKVNELLANSGLAPVKSTNWPYLRDVLRGAGVPRGSRNALTREINVGFKRGWQLTEQDAPMSMTPDVPAAGSFTVQSIHQQETLPPPVTAAVETQRRSLVVRLPVPSTFDPAELSCGTVFSHKGFKYRYTRDSSLAQRRSMDEVLDTYVRDRINPRANSRTEWEVEPRFGKYGVLAHPADPARTGIIHGFWDQRNGSQVPGAEWFYEGNGKVPVTSQGGIWAAQDNTRDHEDVSDSITNASPADAALENPLANKAPKTVLHIKRDSSKWMVDNGSVAKKGRPRGRPRGRPKNRATGVGLSSALSQPLASARSGSSPTKKPKRRKVRRSIADDDDDDEYHPSD